MSNALFCSTHTVCEKKTYNDSINRDKPRLPKRLKNTIICILFGLGAASLNVLLSNLIVKAASPESSFNCLHLD